MAKAPKAKKSPGKVAGSYIHPTDTVPMRPEIGTQANFRKKKPPRTYRYDSSLSPALEWDGNSGRELAEWLIGVIGRASALPAPHQFAKPEEFKDAGGAIVLSVSSLQDGVDALKRLSKPFLNWAGKAERLSFDVPTLPLFVHERLSTQKIVKTLIGHKSDKQGSLLDLFGDPRRSIVDQTLHAYEYPDKWVNRLILGDSLVVMNSLLHYEGLGGQPIQPDPQTARGFRLGELERLQELLEHHFRLSDGSGSRWSADAPRRTSTRPLCSDAGTPYSWSRLTQVRAVVTEMGQHAPNAAQINYAETLAALAQADAIEMPQGGRNAL